MAATSGAGHPWTTRRLLAWIRKRCDARNLEGPAVRVVAEKLLAHVLECDRIALYMEPDRRASPDELERLRGLVRRADGLEPVQYLVGRASFFGREFLVDHSTMIPQPSTEDLVSAVIDWARATSPAPVRLADLGTGSGCVAVSLALALPGIRILATDTVPAALDLARRNALRHDVAARIDLVAGPLLEPLRECGERFDAICGNLPYIPDGEWSEGQVQPAVRRHVPESALRGGAEGLDCIGPVIAGAGGLLRPGGQLFLEIPSARRDAVLGLVERAGGLDHPRVLADYEGLWRVLVAGRPAAG